MNQESKIQKIFETRFEKKYVSALKNSCLKAVRAPVVRSGELTEKLLKDLVDRKICAIHVPGYCERKRALRAAQAILKQAAPKTLETDSTLTASGTAKTDMRYAMGIPRMVAMRGEVPVRKYHADTLRSMRKLRSVFAPKLSPLDRLRLELDEIWPAGASVATFEGKKGLAGVVFVKGRESHFEGAAQARGQIHRDSGVQRHLLSANIYLNVPSGGGDLLIWPVPLDEKAADDPLYQLSGSPFSVDSDIQEVLHHLLPKPHVIRPKAGDLVIIDTARPHCVSAVPRGKRVSIQLALSVEEDLHFSLMS